MSNAQSIVNSIVACSQAIIQQIELAEELNEIVAADSTILTNYFNLLNKRTDITAQDVTNCLAALAQLAFTFNSGSPTQKSYLFKMTP